MKNFEKIEKKKKLSDYDTTKYELLQTPCKLISNNACTGIATMIMFIPETRKLLFFFNASM